LSAERRFHVVVMLLQTFEQPIASRSDLNPIVLVEFFLALDELCLGEPRATGLRHDAALP
jgi:hypothetical protein